MRKLQVSPDLSMPLDVAGEAIAILATRGAGKSYTSAVMIEELYKASVQTVVLDPTGVYWGLRSSAKGTGDGLPIILLGGAHGDIPLEATAGKVIADIVVDTGQSLVMDLSDFESDGAQARFVTDFAERLYRRKARSRTTLHLVVDEADEFAPQKPQKGEERMLGAMLKLVKRGRSRGIGLTLITQRSASIAKNALDLVETLVVMRMLGPRDRDAVEGWIRHKNLQDKAGVLDSLPSLPTGTAWVWAPLRDIMKKVPVRRIETFDSYVTPKPGETRVEPRAHAEVDLEKLGAEIQKTVERAKQDDPKLLRAEITSLKKRIGETARMGEKIVTQPAAVKPKSSDEYRAIEKRLRETRAALESVMKFIATVRTIGFPEKVDSKKLEAAITAAVDRLGQQINAEFGAKRRAFDKWQADGEKLLASLEAMLVSQVPLEITVKHNEPFTVSRAAPQTERARVDRAHEEPIAEGLTGPEQRVLDALAWWGSIGVDSPDKGQIGFLAGYRVGRNVGGTFGNLLGALRGRGLLEYPAPGKAKLTADGAKLARSPNDDPTTEALQRAINDRLEATESRVLQSIINAYPEQLTKKEAGERSGYSVGDNVGGTFGNILGRLRSLGLIERPHRRRKPKRRRRPQPSSPSKLRAGVGADVAS